MASGDWYYANGKDSIGPTSMEALRSKIERGDLPPELLVYSETIGEWTLWSDLHLTPPPPPPPGTAPIVEAPSQAPQVPPPVSAPADSTELNENGLFICPACNQEWAPNLTLIVGGNRFCKLCVKDGHAAEFFKPKKKKKEPRPKPEKANKTANSHEKRRRMVFGIEFDGVYWWLILGLVVVAAGAYFARVWLLDRELAKDPPTLKIGATMQADPEAPWAKGRLSQWRSLVYENDLPESVVKTRFPGMAAMVRGPNGGLFAVTAGTIIAGVEEAGQGNWLKTRLDDLPEWRVASLDPAVATVDLGPLAGEPSDYKNLNALLFPVPENRVDHLWRSAFKLDPIGPRLKEEVTILSADEQGKLVVIPATTIYQLSGKKGLLVISAVDRDDPTNMIGSPVMNEAGRLVGMVVKLHEGQIGIKHGMVGWVMLSSRRIGRPIGVEPAPYPDQE